MSEESLKRKILELEFELSKYRKKDAQLICDKVEKTVQRVLNDEPTTDLIEQIQNQLSKAHIYVVSRQNYLDELNNSLQDGRRPIMWTIQTEKFGIQFIGKNNWTNMRITLIDNDQIPLKTWQKTVHRQSQEKYQFEMQKHPLVTILAIMMDWDPHLDLFMWMPAYAPIFYGFIRSALQCYIQECTEQGLEMVPMGEIMKGY